MYITPISNIRQHNYSHYKRTQPNFTAHPDFYKYNSVASCYFRRGAVLLINNKGYADIENLFYEIFTKNKNTPEQMLIIGIGKSQEPLSYLASIKGIIKDKPLDKNVDLYTVDLQSRPDEKFLRNNAFCHLYHYEKFPEYAGKSFVKDSYKRWMGIEDQTDYLDPVKKYLLYKEPREETLYYRVNDEIFEFLNKTYNNPNKSLWDSPIQEVIGNYPDNKFRIVSANNVLPYIVYNDKIIPTIKHIKRILKTGGYFITDPYKYPQEYINAGVLDNMREISAGIYQKTT